MLIKDLLFAPVYLYQGSKIKRDTVRLPEAQGERYGSVVLNEIASNKAISHGDKSGEKVLNLMIVGDSSAAGVGVASQDQALTGHLLKCLKTAGFMRRRFDRVNWSLHATTGHTSFDVLRRLYVLSAPETPIDLMVVVVGVNDTTSNVKAKQWQNQIKEIIAVSQRKFGAEYILFSCLPPMADMPALPSPLADFVGAKALSLDKMLQRICDQHANVNYLHVDFKEAGLNVNEMFATDGFHPNGAAYEYWAKKMVRRIATFI